MFALLAALPLFAASEVQLQTLPVPSCQECIARWADFNGDGLDDIVVQNEIIPAQIQFNLGGHFAPPVPVAEVRPMPVDYVLFAADFNRDGFADLIVNEAGHTIYGGPGPDGMHHLLLGDGSGAFPTEVPLPADRSRTYQVADFTGDGVPDLLQLDLKTKEVLIYRNSGSATFTLHQALAWPSNTFLWRSGDPVATGDVNSDGRPDLIIASPRHLNFFLSQPDGRFAPVVSHYTRDDIFEIKAGDVNGDGKADVAFLMQNNPEVRVKVLLGDGNGHFPGTTEVSVKDIIVGTRRIETDPTTLLIGDFAAGGANEIAIAQPEGDVVLYTVQNERLREVARTTTGAWNTQVLTARMRTNAPELVAVGKVFRPDHYTAWVITPQGEIGPAPSQPHSRQRSVGRVAGAVINGEYDVTVESRCSVSGLSSFTLRREGMFVDIDNAEAVYLDGVIDTTFTIREGNQTRVLNGALVPDSTGTLRGKLIESGDTPCGGWQVYRVTAVPTRIQ